MPSHQIEIEKMALESAIAALERNGWSVETKKGSSLDFFATQGNRKIFTEIKILNRTDHLNLEISEKERLRKLAMDAEPYVAIFVIKSTSPVDLAGPHFKKVDS